LLVARVTPPLVADAAADHAFTTDATIPTTPGRGLDIRAVVSGLTETQSIDQLTKFIDDLPAWGTPQVSASPLFPYTDPRSPKPVVRTPDGQHQVIAIVYSQGDANTSLVPAPGTTPVETGDEPAVWVPDTVAAELGVTSGDSINTALLIPNPSPQELAAAAGVNVRVAGVYQTALGVPVSKTVDWESLRPFLPSDPLDKTKRAALLITDTATAVPLISAIGDRAFVQWDAPWDVPTTLRQGRIGAAAWRTLDAQLHDSNSHPGQVTAVAHVEPVTLSSGVDLFVAHAEDSAAELEPLVSSIGFAAQVISLAVLATMLWLLARSRRTEHLASLRMGMHPLRLGFAGMVEQIGAVVAAVIGVFAIVRWAPGWLADSGSFDQHTLATARHAVLWSLPWLIVFVILAVTAAVWPLEPTANIGTGRLAGAFRWEAIVVIAAVATGAQLVTQQGPALHSGSALLFPLLALLAAAAVVVRIIGHVVARTRRARPRRVEPPRSLATWLARRRLTFVITEVSALVVVVAAGAGMFLYSTSVARDGERGITDKAAALGAASATRSIGAASELFVGADGFPAGLPHGWSVVWRGSDVNMAPNVVADVLVVDPQSFPETAAWRDSFADKSLPSLMADLANPPQSTVNVIVAGNYNDTFPTNGTLSMQGLFASYHVVDRIAAAPGQRERSSMVIIDERTLAPLIPNVDGSIPGATGVGGIDRVFLSEVWSSGSQQALDDALVETTDHIDQTGTTNVSTESRRPDFIAFHRSLPYLRLAGAAMLLVALASLWVHGSRRRTALAIDVAMARAMGVRRRVITAALVLESVLVGLLTIAIATAISSVVVAFMAPRLDPAPSFAPANSGGLSWPAVGATAALVVAVSILGNLLELRTARRLPVAEVLRGTD